VRTVRARAFEAGGGLQDEWLDRIGGIIGERIALYSAKEIRFNLMALVKDHRAEHAARIALIKEQLAKGDDAALASEMHHLQEALDAENARHERWRVENVRRKHNYIPFIFNVLQVLAERDELAPLLDKAKAAAKAKRAAGAEGKQE
jgi:ubiquitin carboxyl-terminal hydrolase L5